MVQQDSGPQDMLSLLLAPALPWRPSACQLCMLRGPKARAADPQGPLAQPVFQPAIVRAAAAGRVSDGRLLWLNLVQYKSSAMAPCSESSPNFGRRGKNVHCHCCYCSLHPSSYCHSLL